MQNHNICVVLLGRPPAERYRQALEASGYMTVMYAAPDVPVRDVLRRALEGDPTGIITVEPAAGYSAEEVNRIALALMENPDKLYVGEPTEPPKRNLVEQLYSFLAGVDAASAQTSLFGMSASTGRVMVQMKSADDTFLMNMPLEARANSIDVEEMKTDVQAPAPDFHLLTKSFKLYYVFLKFSVAAMIAYVVDIGTFGLFEIWFGFLSDEYKILVATILSRILCSVATYILNRGAVFKSQAKQTGTVVRFLILAAAQLIASWLLVWGIGSLFGGSDLVNMILKVVVDFVIFMASFTIQRDWVFREKPAEDK